jgi:hypothetical protein
LFVVAIGTAVREAVVPFEVDACAGVEVRGCDFDPATGVWATAALCGVCGGVVACAVDDRDSDVALREGVGDPTPLGDCAPALLHRHDSN